MQIQIKPKRTVDNFSGTDLPIRKSIELANYYFGFNQWNTQVLSLCQEANETPRVGLFRCNG
jgi:recombination DNA repair RAD52 pathway protein